MIKSIHLERAMLELSAKCTSWSFQARLDQQPRYYVRYTEPGTGKLRQYSGDSVHETMERAWRSLPHMQEQKK